MKKRDEATIITSVWVVMVSIFLFIVIDNSLEKMGSEIFIKNSVNEKVLKSESKSKVKYKIEDGDGNFKYSWTFNKTRELDTEIDKLVDLSIDTDVINAKIERLIDMNGKLLLTFYHHGELPSTGKIEIDVSDSFNDGDRLYLYYFNEDDDQIEYIDDNILVKDGYADFEIEHCSEYILSKSVIEGSVHNYENYKAYFFYVMIMMIIVFTLKTVLFKGK